MNRSKQNPSQPRRDEAPETDGRNAPRDAEAIPPQPRAGDTQSIPATAAKPVSLRRMAGDGPRIWALPDKNLKWWILREDDTGDARGLTDGIPAIYIPELSSERKTAVAERCREFVASRLRDRWHEDLFNLIKRMLLGGILTLGGLVGLRFIEYFDVPLLLGALGYTAYAAIRYGGRFMRSLEAASRPFSNFVGEPFVVNALSERIAKALVFRRNLPSEKRGSSPDEELLDANAYRKLIREGVISRVELCALGRAIENRLDVTLDEPKRLSDMSRAEGLDAESASLYRDLALAAAEIAFDSEFN